MHENLKFTLEQIGTIKTHTRIMHPINPWTQMKKNFIYSSTPNILMV
jgi:hypothetical protein